VAKDVELEFHGTINLLRPLTPKATSWIDENIPDEAQWLARHSQSSPATPRISWPE
jgi:hypothetical protein